MLNKIINIPNQEEILKELVDNFPIYFGKLDEVVAGFQGCDVNLIKQTCPKLCAFLAEKNLLTSLERRRHEHTQR